MATARSIRETNKQRKRGEEEEEDAAEASSPVYV
jgi:hypothetical protein